MSINDEKSHIDVRIDDPHRTALLRLVKISGQKTAISTLRNLIRDAAIEAGVWPEHEMIAHSSSNGAIAEPQTV